MDRFHVIATNDVTSTLIARKYTLAGALSLACDLLECWDDVVVREYSDTSDLTDEAKELVHNGDYQTYKIVARLSGKGLL